MARPKKRHTLQLRAIARELPRVPADSVGTTITLSHPGQAGAIRVLVEPGRERDALDEGGLRWYEVVGFGDAVRIGALSQALGIPNHDVEDLLFAARPALAERDDARLLTLRAVWPGGALDTGRIGIWWRENVVVTFIERPNPVFDTVAHDLGRPGCRVVQRGGGYLLYRLLDGVADALQPPVDLLADRLDELEVRALLPTARGALAELHDLSRQPRSLHRCATTTRRVIADLAREADEVLDPPTIGYLHDLERQTAQAEELALHYREVAGDISSLIQGMANARLNAVMRLLAAVSTVFMPLTFIVGVYGMNFDTAHPWNMPELRSPWGYPAVIAGMAVLSLGLLSWFRRQGWTELGQAGIEHGDPGPRPGRTER